MVKTAILTDGINDLSQEIIDDYEITTIPYRIFIDEEMYQIWHNEKCTISLDDFCVKLKACSKDNLPRTSLPTPKEFHDGFDAALAKSSSVLAIFQSGKMSGTIQTAHGITANGYKGKDIDIFDSQKIMTGSGIQVLEAAKMAKQGNSKKEILDRLEAINPRVRTILIMNDLNYLYKKGRIGRAKRLLGSALNMIPAIHIDDGEPDALGTFKGEQNLTKQLKEFCTRILSHCETNDIFLTHINQHEITGEVFDAMMDANEKDVTIHYKEAGPIMGVYTGPKAICISYIGNWDPKWLF